jgi:small-conductance mechanosensitive channel
MILDDPLRWQLLDNTVARWLAAAAILVACIGLFYLVKRVLVLRLQRLSARTATGFDDLFVDLVRRTRFFFVFMLALVATSYVLVLPARVHDVVEKLAVLAAAIQLMIWGNGVISFSMARYASRHAGTAHGASETTVTALSYLGRFVLFLVILLIALDNLGIRVTALVTGLGVGGIAVALAVQNVLGDLFGALSIVLDKPFVVGDAIAVDTFEGTVEHIGLKTTRVRAGSGEQLIFSNADLLRSRIRNFKRMEERRVQFALLLPQDTSPDAVERLPALLRDVVSGQPDVRFDRAHFKRIGEASLEFEVVYYLTTPDYAVYADTQQAINLALLRRLRDAGVSLALPTRAVVVRGGTGTPDGRDVTIAAASLTS